MNIEFMVVGPTVKEKDEISAKGSCIYPVSHPLLLFQTNPKISPNKVVIINSVININNIPFYFYFSQVASTSQ